MTKRARAAVIKLPYLTDRINYRDSADVVAQGNAAAEVYAAASASERAGKPNALREEVRRWAERYNALRTEMRENEVAAGMRHPQGMADIVSHISGDGVPDTSTPEGDAYWKEVGRAAKLGVPNVFGTQR